MTDRSVDPTFNGTVAGGVFTIVYGILVQPDGKVMVGGTFDTVNGVTNKNMMRLTSTGENDPTWDNGIGAANGCGTTVEDFAPLPDGRLFIAASQVHTLRGISGINSQIFYTGITNRYGIGQVYDFNLQRGTGRYGECDCPARQWKFGSSKNRL